MKNEIRVDQECGQFSTVAQVVNETCSSSPSDQVTSCVEGSGSFGNGVPSCLDDKCNASTLHISAAIINNVMLNCSFIRLMKSECQ